VSTPDLNSRPRLAVGCRLNEKSQTSRVLLMPEKALRLSGPSLEIVERCDGNRTTQEIVSDLQKIYSKADAEKVKADILSYLARLHDDGAIDFVIEKADHGGGAP
jgi:pyrroloquinoline quinone biosynthesis protein D